MSKPIYVFDGTQWQIIGPVVNEAPISVQATAPTNPATGDLWVDTSTAAPTIDATTLATKNELSSVEAVALLGL